MASSSTNSSIRKSFKYDVFLSFRGEDTRNNFVGHLYHALQQEGIETYKDSEKIEKGKTISDQLAKSIEDSRFYIIVFSKKYASSSWCLDELVKIMECQRTVGHTAYPVFYDVEPAEVRKQSGAVGKAFSNHKKLKAAGKWKETMKEASNLAGWELKKSANGDESKLIQTIVDEIFEKLCSISLSVDGKLVGMETRVSNVLSSLKSGTDDVRVIGIKGMGGGGKTTLAKAIYEQISIEFEGRSFVDNVRESSKSSLSGLKKLQKQVLSDVLNRKDIKVSSILDGTNMMGKMMRDRKVLIVLDDVDHRSQLEALAGDLNWFKSGSRIIVTTREEHVLIAHGVKLMHDVNLLTNVEATCLFSRYAFDKEAPIHGYKKLSTQVIQYASGLPLTIRVLGSFLCGKSELEWIDAMERLNTFPLKDTLEILELSYNALEDDCKEIFLDVACILKGEKKDKAIRVLKSCGFHASIGLKVLEQKSLITISEYGRLGMHDHLEEMGKNIVRRLHPNEPHRHSRLWNNKEIEDVLANNMVNEEIRCIKLLPQRLDYGTVMRGLRNMKKLRILYMHFGSNWNDSEVSQCFPNDLRYLSWRAYPFGSLHETFQADNLVGLDMSFGSIVEFQRGEKGKVLDKLRFLDLSYTSLIVLDVGLTPNIEILDLEECLELTELHIPNGCPKLKYLGLDNSTLWNLNLGSSPDLETLSLLGCYDLEELHIPFGCPELKYLSVNGSKLRILDLGLASNLETLSLKGCQSVGLHMPFGFLNLRSLDLSHSKLRILDIGLTPNLERLYLSYCYDLEEIMAPVGWLKKLTYLHLSGCGRFESFLFNKQTQPAEDGSLSELHLIAESLSACRLHQDSSLLKFRFTCLYKENAAASSGNLEKLMSFGLCSCTNLERFSESICSLQFIKKLTIEGSIPDVPTYLGRLDFLEELTLSFTDNKHLPDSVCLLKQLKCLKLQHCEKLEKLPDDLGQLECLEKLVLHKCLLLQDIPDSICEMKRLKYLHLPLCEQVEKLPEELGRLECLKELDITDTGISHLPHSIFSLKGLLIVGSSDFTVQGSQLPKKGGLCTVL